MKILPPALTLLFAAGMAAAHFIEPNLIFLDYPHSVWGLLPAVIGLAISFIAADHFGRQKANIQTFGEPNRLVTNGLFAYTRNPMYLGMALFLSGIAALSGSLVALALLAIFVVIVDRWYISFEEKAMLRNFGEQYAGYAKKVRRWL